MKKILILLTSLVAGITLTSFVVNDQSTNNNEMGSDWIYYTSVTAWYEATESETLYIYYKQGNGVRKYMYSYYKESNFQGGYYYIEENPYYRDKNCRDFRKNYRYCTGIQPIYYFNANLPYMEKK